MTLEALNRLRRNLSPLAAGEAAPEELSRYLDFYHLGFDAEFPGLDHRLGTVASGPFQLATHCWRHPNAVANLLIVHGYMDHTGLFSKLVHFGLSHRCNVVIFDLPGHGLSTGDDITIRDFAQYGDAVDDVLAACALPDLPWLALDKSVIDRDDPVSSVISTLNFASAGILRKADDAPATLSPLVTSSAEAMEIDTAKLQGRPDIRGLVAAYQPDGKRHVIAARVGGTVPTAFPDGPPKPPEVHQ